jgi:hypothetical protein
MHVPDFIDTPPEVLTILTIVGLLFAALSWLIKAQIVQNRELQPNHGSSLRDAVDRIERGQAEMREDLREVRGQVNEQHDRLFNSVGKVHARIDEHIKDHLQGKA